MKTIEEKGARSDIIHQQEMRIEKSRMRTTEKERHTESIKAIKQILQKSGVKAVLALESVKAEEDQEKITRRVVLSRERFVLKAENA